MVKKTLRLTASLGIAALALAGCGTKASTTGSGTTASSNPSAGTTASGGTAAGGGTGGSGKKFNACMVLDVGGVDDRSFNQSSWQGLQDAKKQNPDIAASYVSSSSQNDYVPNLNAQVHKGCDTTIAVGGLMADAVKTVASKNAGKHFGEVDAPSSGPNVYGMQFNTAQGGFLGGYLAAAMTKTGKVATYGGLSIPPVTIYMDGFWEGVQYYNKQKGKSVQVLGWDETNQKGGTFAQSFTDQNKGRSITQSFAQAGADVVFPVAGGTGLGSGAAAAASGGQLMVLWVDTDGCVSAHQYCKYFLSSVVKNLAGAVTKYTTAAASGSFPQGNYIGTLKNGGTGLAPFHEFDSKVPSAVKSELDKVKSDIQSGAIKVSSPSQPK